MLGPSPSPSVEMLSVVCIFFHFFVTYYEKPSDAVWVFNVR